MYGLITPIFYKFVSKQKESFLLLYMDVIGSKKNMGKQIGLKTLEKISR